jgi:hypothetical protein
MFASSFFTFLLPTSVLFKIPTTQQAQLLKEGTSIKHQKKAIATSSTSGAIETIVEAISTKAVVGTKIADMELTHSGILERYVTLPIQRSHKRYSTSPATVRFALWGCAVGLGLPVLFFGHDSDIVGRGRGRLGDGVYDYDVGLWSHHRLAPLPSFACQGRSFWSVCLLFGSVIWIVTSHSLLVDKKKIPHQQTKWIMVWTLNYCSLCVPPHLPVVCLFNIISSSPSSSHVFFLLQLIHQSISVYKCSLECSTRDAFCRTQQ